VKVIKEKIKVNDGIQNGTLVWIELNDGERYTYNQIRMEQLRRKVQRLETRLASNNK